MSGGGKRKGKGNGLSAMARGRLTKELALLAKDPPPGICAYLASEDDMREIRAQLSGFQGTPFEGGVYLVSIRITARYPMEPPRCRFVNSNGIYHPNVDSAGRICLDTLKQPPAGTWSPAVSLPSLLLSLASLLADPNPDDALVPELAQLYLRDPTAWAAEARRRKSLHATPAYIATLEAESNELQNENQASQHKPDEKKTPQTASVPTNSNSSELKKSAVLSKENTPPSLHVSEKRPLLDESPGNKIPSQEVVATNQSNKKLKSSIL
eukprot:scaffold140826_cov60-Attheya_sp.AAC.1